MIKSSITQLIQSTSEKYDRVKWYYLMNHKICPRSCKEIRLNKKPCSVKENSSMGNNVLIYLIFDHSFSEHATENKNIFFDEVTE